MPEGEDSSIDRLKKKLYARDSVPELRERRKLTDEHHDVVADGWTRQEDLQPNNDSLAYNPEQELALLREGIVSGATVKRETIPAVFNDVRVQRGVAEPRAKRRIMMRLVKTVFFASFVFFLISAGIAGYFYWAEYNQVACNRIPIEVTGSSAVPGGKEYIFEVGIENGNPVALTDAVLIFDYPEGARSPEDTSSALTVVRETIGTIESDERVRATGRVVLFGREQTEQTIGLSMEYRIKDSNALFTCRKEHVVRIATSPVSLKVDGIQEIASGQELALTITIRSNAEQVVPNQRLLVEYPFGYQFVRAEPKPTHDTNVWDIGDVGQGHERTIVIRGQVQAQTTESRTVRVTLGEGDSADSARIENTLQFVEHPLTITRPFLALELALNGKADPVISARLGDHVTGHLRYTNTLPDPVYNVSVEAVLPSMYVDRSEVTVDQGFFRSVDQTILWTPNTQNVLKEIGPGETGVLGFSFLTQSPIDVPVLRTPSMDISFTVNGQRVRDNIPVQQTLLSQAQRTIRFMTSMAFRPAVAYSVGPFKNTGSHPPKVDQETTYTVIWHLENTINEVKGVQVKGTLPIYVSWQNKIDPESEGVTYNPMTREVLWTAGDVSAHTGSVEGPREVAFQVALIPSITQLGSEVDLVTDLSARGIDTFTEDVIEQRVSDQTTAITDVSDPMFRRDQGRVIN